MREAGLQPNVLAVAQPDEVLIREYIALIRELGRFPIESDLRLKGNRVLARLGNKRHRANKVLEYARQHAGCEDVIPFCEAIAMAKPLPNERPTSPSVGAAGYVYLIRHGTRAEYKIGKTFNPVRREGELRLELPEQLQPIHYIKTDDASGVEEYWHKRFDKKRKGGEFFALTLNDVQAFKRWKRIF